MELAKFRCIENCPNRSVLLSLGNSVLVLTLVWLSEALMCAPLPSSCVVPEAEAADFCTCGLTLLICQCPLALECVTLMVSCSVQMQAAKPGVICLKLTLI